MGPRRRPRAIPAAIPATIPAAMSSAIPGINQPIPHNPVVLQDVTDAVERDICI